MLKSEDVTAASVADTQKKSFCYRLQGISDHRTVSLEQRRANETL